MRLALIILTALMLAPVAQAKYERRDLTRVVSVPVYCASASEYTDVPNWAGLFWPAERTIWLKPEVCTSLSELWRRIAPWAWRFGVAVLAHEYAHSLGLLDEHDADVAGARLRPLVAGALVRSYNN